MLNSYKLTLCESSYSNFLIYFSNEDSEELKLSSETAEFRAGLPLICVNMPPVLWSNHNVRMRESNFAAMVNPLNSLGLSFGQFFRGIKAFIVSF